MCQTKEAHDCDRAPDKEAVGACGRGALPGWPRGVLCTWVKVHFPKCRNNALSSPRFSVVTVTDRRRTGWGRLLWAGRPLVSLCKAGLRS